jgi:hypothetical protein
MRHTLFIATAVLAAACNPFPSDIDRTERTVTIPAIDWEANARGDFGTDDWAEVDLAHAEMRGKLPRIGTFDDADGYGTATVDKWDGNQWVNLTLNTLDGSGWGMIGASLDIDPATGEATYTAADLIGCAGPEEFDAAFDEPPSTGEVEATLVQVDGEDMVQIVVTGEFQGETVEGVALLPAADPGVGISPEDADQ